MSVHEAVASIDAGSPDGTAGVYWFPGSSTAVNGGLVFRMKDSSHYWMADFYYDTLFLHRVNGSTTTQVAAVQLGHPGMTAKYFEVRLAGSAIEVWCDGALRLQTSDGYSSGATRFGMHWWPGADPGAQFGGFFVRGGVW